MRLWQKMIATWLDLAQDDIGAGLQDEKHDGEDHPCAEHVDRFFDTSKTLVEFSINVCWN